MPFIVCATHLLDILNFVTNSLGAVGQFVPTVDRQLRCGLPQLLGDALKSAQSTHTLS
jgi:hypothetical protein